MTSHLNRLPRCELPTLCRVLSGLSQCKTGTFVWMRVYTYSVMQMPFVRICKTAGKRAKHISTSQADEEMTMSHHRQHRQQRRRRHFTPFASPPCRVWLEQWFEQMICINHNYWLNLAHIMWARYICAFVRICVSGWYSDSKRNNSATAHSVLRYAFVRLPIR